MLAAHGGLGSGGLGKILTPPAQGRGRRVRRRAGSIKMIAGRREGDKAGDSRIALAGAKLLARLASRRCLHGRGGLGKATRHLPHLRPS